MFCLSYTLDDSPNMAELTSFVCSNGDRLNIAEEIGTSYTEFGAQILDDRHGNRVENMEHKYQRDSKRINCAIFRDWLKGGEKYPVTWTALVQVLDIIGKGTVSDYIRDKKKIVRKPSTKKL